jgi:tetratricopeptide (TPR) repeat protein
VTSGGDPDFQTVLALFYADEAPSLTAEGLNALEQTIASVPENADARAGYGWALHILGETERGLAEIDRALELAPGNPRALFYKASSGWKAAIEDAVPLLRQVAESPSPFAVQAQRVLTNLGH